VLSYPDFAYYLAPAFNFKDISANSGSNVMSDLYLADIRSGEESAQSDLLLGGLLSISDSGTSLLFFLTLKKGRVHSVTYWVSGFALLSHPDSYLQPTLSCKARLIAPGKKSMLSPPVRVQSRLLSFRNRI